MRRLRIGMIDLDTSHPPSWLPIIRDLGHEVVAVWDGGSVQEDGFAQRFAEEHGIENAPADLQDMVPLVDVAIIHSCNWDLHVPRARLFVEAGKAVIIDKPMFGNYRDAQQILAWAAEGARIAGGSSLRFTEEARAFLAQPVEERGTPQAVLAGCGVDEFNYGIHAYSIAWSILGGGVRAVRWLGCTPSHQQVEAVWHDGRRAIMTMPAAGQWLPFWVTVVTEKAVHHLVPEAGKVYRALLEPTLAYLADEEAEAPIPVPELIEPELAALAARSSRERGGVFVAISELRRDDPGYDGAAFAEQCRQQKLQAKR